MRLIQRYKCFSVKTARTLDEAKDLLNAADLDLIVLDLNLPHKRGGPLDLEAGRLLLEEIKSRSTAQLPTVVILSNYEQNAPQVSTYRVADFPFVARWFHKADDREELSRYLAELAWR